MVCSTCGAVNRAERRFCGRCGSQLILACPSCGAANEPADRFCGSCGAGLGAAAVGGARADAVPAAAASELRLVSVLFADLVGFTTLSEHRDPEAVRELLSRYFERCRALIERYGGMVEKFIGDAVMAVWGTPVAREDDAERAVRAALALTGAVPSLGDELGMPGLRVRAGVLTGPAAVDLAAEGEGMVLGDTVNTAARLQSVAAPGTVLVDDVTRRASEAAIAYEEAGTHELRGRERPVRAWTALRVVAGVGGARRGPGLESPFVGREAELRHIVSEWEATVSTGSARIVRLIGEAGTGKSRLLWEFYKHVDGLETPVWYHQGRCLSYGEGVGYWALAEMVRSRAGISEEEAPATARVKLRETIERFVSAERERRLIEPRLAHLLGLEERVAPDRADLFSGWRLFFERLAATGPITFVFEDLQWADAGLLDFIDYLLEWSAEFPIFVLALGRPQLVDVRPGWRADIVLGALPDAAMREALEALVPGLPEEVSARILERAEGVPLYAVETVRMLLDRGLLEQRGSRYVVTGDVGDLDVPETLHALVAARLDGLDAAERLALQVAAVLGQSFTPAAVAALAGHPPAEARAILDRLVSKQVLAYEDHPSSPERGQYRFLQGLLRTVAYGTLSRRDRKGWHLAAARHLQETLPSDGGEIAEVLASHFLAAADADPDAADAPRIRASARETLAEAGRRALSLALGRQAQHAFDRAAELADDEEERATLLEQAGRAAWLEADTPAARERLDAAIALYEAHDRPQAAAGVNTVIADMLWTSDQLDEAVDLAERAYAALTEDTLARAVAAATLGKLRAFRDDAEGTLEATAEALRIAEPLQEWDTVANALITRGTGLVWIGRMQEGYALTRHATDIALARDLPTIAMRGMNNLGWMACLRDELHEALAELERCDEIARARGDRVWVAQSAVALATVRAELGDWDAVERAVGASYEIPSGELVVLNSEGYVALTTIRAARGDREGLATLERQAGAGLESPDDQVRESCEIAYAAALAARDDHERALGLFEPMTRRTLTIYRDRAVLGVLESAMALGREALVEDTVQFVRELAPAAATPTMRAYADRFAALLTARRGETDAALRLLARAALTLRERGRGFERAKVLLEQGELLAAAHRTAEAAPVLREARDVFAGLRAEPWRERAERARGVEAGAAVPVR